MKLVIIVSPCAGRQELPCGADAGAVFRGNAGTVSKAQGSDSVPRSPVRPWGRGSRLPPEFVSAAVSFYVWGSARGEHGYFLRGV